MKRQIAAVLLATTALATALAGCSTKTEPKPSTPAADAKPAPVTLNIAVAGDTNMADLFKDAIGAEFTKQNPNITLNVVGVGPGDAGSQAIFTKLDAQKQANKEKWDLDVAVVHQSIMGQMLQNGLVTKYLDGMPNAKYVVGEGAKNALGTDVTGYVVPMFASQTAIAYTPDVKTVPNSYEELVTWIKANPGKFGYNGVKGGMSGVAFVTGYTYWKTGAYKELATGTVDTAKEKDWPAIMKELKALPVTYTNGNNGTLDMLNRGEIQMGPVWVDMYYTWVREGRMNPNVKLKLIAPGMPGQPMYFVLPSKATNADAAKKFIDFMADPGVQAKFIVERNGWYPGIDANAVMPKVADDAKSKLFSTISADELATKGQQFPLAQYLKDVQAIYEQN